MKPSDIPAGEVWEGAELATFGAPEGLERLVQPVQALVDQGPKSRLNRVSVRLVLEDGDLEKLAAGATVWLTFYGGMVPWSIDIPYELVDQADAPASSPALVDEPNPPAQLVCRSCLTSWADTPGAPRYCPACGDRQPRPRHLDASSATVDGGPPRAAAS